MLPATLAFGRGLEDAPVADAVVAFRAGMVVSAALVATGGS